LPYWVLRSEEKSPVRRKKRLIGQRRGAARGRGGRGITLAAIPPARGGLRQKEWKGGRKGRRLGNAIFAPTNSFLVGVKEQPAGPRV